MSHPMPKPRIRTNLDVLAAVPALLGFRPGDGSLVMLAVADDRPVFAIRTDLPGPDVHGDVLLDLGGHIADVTLRVDPNAEIFLVGYGAADHLDPALHTFAEVFTTCGLSVRQPLRVTDRRIVHVGHDHRGRSSDGTLVGPLPSRIPAETTATASAALPDRAAKTGLLGPVETASGDAMQQAVTRATARLQPMIHDEAAVDEAAATAIADAVSRHTTGTPLDDQEVAWLAVLLAQPSVWDLAVDHAEPDAPHLAFWTEITRRIPDPLVPAPATLLAVTAWQIGDGDTAALAAERALHADPSHDLAELILCAVHNGVTLADVMRTHPGPASLTDLGPR